MKSIVQYTSACMQLYVHVPSTKLPQWCTATILSSRYSSTTPGAWLLHASLVRWKKEAFMWLLWGMRKFIKRFKQYCTIVRIPGSERHSKITPVIKQLGDTKLVEDDETTAMQLQKMLLANRFQLSINMILRSWSKLGWTFRNSTYCQLIRDVNKAKRVEWASAYLQVSQTDSFQEVIWTDECSVQLETHHRHSYRRKGELPTLKPRWEGW